MTQMLPTTAWLRNAPAQDLGIDVDEVLLDSWEGLRFLAQEIAQRPLVRLNDSWNLSERWGISPAQTADVFEAWWTRGLRQGQPLEGSIAALNLLHEAGHRIHLITSIDPRAQQHRLERLHELGARFTSLHVVGHGTSKEKALRLTGSVAQVDDLLRNLKAGRDAGVAHRVWICADPHQEQGVDPADAAVTAQHETFSHWVHSALGLDPAPSTQPVPPEPAASKSRRVLR